ncbi:hypothetical protein B0H19DRAFT_1224474 [Mycena capillaripes]|nr:hypothetical protein B0H19DRAFT_1224474 [Mycena capillaripes]
MSTARPPRAPPLISVPSTPGPELPGGYPRNSVVFSTNQWDHSTAKNEEPATKPNGTSGLLAATKAYLPPAVASYFPLGANASNTTSSSSSSDTISPGSAGHTPSVALHTPSSVMSDSDFSTRAYAGSGSSRALSTPTQGDFPPASPNPEAAGDADPATDADSNTPHSVPHSSPDTTESNSPSEARSISDGSASTAPTTIDPTDSAPNGRRVYPGVVPIPSVAPFASVLTSTGRTSRGRRPDGSNAPDAVPASDAPTAASHASPTSSNSSGSASNTTTSTAPSSASPTSPNKGVQFVFSPMAESSPSPKGSGLGASIKRFASLRSRRDKKGAPPSAFADPTHGHTRGGSVDSSLATSASPVSASSPNSSAAMDPSAAQPNDTVRHKPSRRASLLRALHLRA